MPIKLRPLSDRLVVKPDPAETMSKGGIHVPSSARYVPQIGTVLAAGPGWVSQVPLYIGAHDLESFPRRPMVIHIGDRIFYPKNAGSVVQIERDEFIIIRESDVLAFVMEDEDEDAPAPDLSEAYLDPTYGTIADS